MLLSRRFSIRASWSVVGPALLLFTASVALARQPPPLPTEEARAAFIQAEQAGFDLDSWSGLPRAVHDEYDVTHYDVSLNLNIPAHIITGVVDVEAKAQVSNLTQIALDLYTPMIVDAVQVNGVPAAFTHPGGVITVTLDRTYQPDEAFRVTCAYHGTPSYTGTPFRWNAHAGGSAPMIMTYSEPYGAPAWWVCKDDPKDKATFDIHVTAPDTLITVSNGIMESTVPNGNGTTTTNWSTSFPMSTYLFSLAVTNFRHWSEVYTALDSVRTMNVDYFAYPEDLTKAQTSWSNNIQMMEYFAGLFGEYPFLTEKYALAEVNHPGAMEHQTATSMGSGWINGTNSNDSVVAHELSHSWVGDMITMREYSHAWTKEGFATLCEALYFEDLYGLAYYHQYMDGLNVLSYATKQLYNCNPPLDATIYYKGAWVLHMIRHLIGDPTFFTAIHDYTNNPALMYKVNTTEDLRAAFEAASRMDLGWFFDQWVYHPGYPQIVQTWQAAPGGGGYDVTLTLFQVQTVGPIFKLPLDVAVHTSLGDERFAIQDSLFSQTFAFHVSGVPQSVELDPDHWMILKVLSGTDVAEQGEPVAGPRVWSEPNPSRATTNINFTLSRRDQTRLQIFDSAGRLVSTLLNRPAGPGTSGVVWDGRGEDGRAVSSGVYYRRLDQGAVSSWGRIVLVR